jgi:hypothetical protein
MAESSYVERISQSLDDGARKAFLSLVHYLHIDDDDKQLALVAAIAPLVTDLHETAANVDQALEDAKKLPIEIRRIIDDAMKTLDERAEVIITSKVAAAMELMTQEIRSMARDTAVSEYSAAALLRSQAIKDEVRALQSATEHAIAAGASIAPSGDLKAPAEGGNVAGRGASRVPVWFKYGAAVCSGAVFAAMLLHHH